MDINFEYPMHDKIIFNISTNNEMGFTRRELLTQILKRYKMIIDMHKFYDLDKNCWCANEIVDNELFKTTLKWQFNLTLISAVVYNKDDGKWRVTFNDYI